MTKTPEAPMFRVPEVRTFACRPGWLERLQAVVGADAVKSGRDELLVYECDAFTVARSVPAAVAFPRDTAQAAAVVRILAEHDIPVVPRGAATSLAGGTYTPAGGVVVSTARMNRILEVDIRNRLAVVQAGLVNAHLTREVTNASGGWHYAPDPSSQGACTIGGNVATNAGGPHTLKYGVTVNHTLGLTSVLADGSVLTTGGKVEDAPGYNLTGLIVGSEGTLGLVTEAVVRLTRHPSAYRTLLAVYDSADGATNTVSEIIASGILPAALEMMDTLMIRAVEDAFHFGFPTDAGAVLIIELDGIEAGLDESAAYVREICLRNAARTVRQAATAQERLDLWKCRKKAFGAIGRLSPSYCTQDGVIPRTKLPEMLRTVRAVGERYGLAVANVFHAGDGNLHPVILFDERDPSQVTRALRAGDEILHACVDAGGSVTGEHGIGIEKVGHLPLLFSPEDLSVMLRIRKALNPTDLINPEKVFACGTGCLEDRPRHPGRRAAV
jgi:glycolate oxidase